MKVGEFIHIVVNGVKKVTTIDAIGSDGWVYLACGGAYNHEDAQKYYAQDYKADYSGSSFAFYG